MAGNRLALALGGPLVQDLEEPVCCQASRTQLIYLGTLLLELI